MKDNHLLQLTCQIIFTTHRELKKRLVSEMINPFEIFNFNGKSLKQIGVKNGAFNQIADPLKTAECELRKANELGIKVLHNSDPNYPNQLSTIYDSPYFLYVLGDIKTLQTRTLGIVGSRKHSSYGERIVRSHLSSIVLAQITTVSGMAYGIDSLAHRVSIESGGKTIGVNAGGLMHLYPKGNCSLFPMIIQNGCIVSEFPLDTRPRPHHFPIRNRIIAALSEKVWVIEAAEHSGSLITARLALEAGKDVFASPGPVDLPTCKGTNRLIGDGAKPILSPCDILDEYNIRHNDQSNHSPFKSDDPIENCLLDILRENELKDIDFLVEKASLNAHLVISALNGLLLKQRVTQHPGGLWTIK